MASRPRISIAQLVDLVAQLQHDQARNERELRQRDAEIGRSLRERRGDAAAMLAGWLDAVGDPDLPGHHASAALRTAIALLVLVGLGLGWGSAAAVYFYDGTHPVNVIHVVAVYVVAPVGLLVITALAATAGRGQLGEALRALSPGRLLGLLARLLPRRYREGTELVLGAGRRQQRAIGAVQKWLVLAGSQVFAVAFFTGAVIGATHLIVFTDLAFGWSTTLDAGAEELHDVTEAIALPWSWAWSDAAPTLEMVQTTLYRRSVDAVDDSPLWRAWWPFLLTAMIVYGLLPRVVCLVLAARRLGQVTRRTFARMPGTAVVLDRLAPVIDVEVSGAQPTSAGYERPAAEAAAAAAEPASAGAAAGGAAVVIDWADAAPDRATLHAGGARTLAEDRATVAAAAEQLAGGDPDRVVVFVRGWEPPMLEALDFLTDLRQAIGPDVLIRVRPIGGDPVHLAGWKQKCTELEDARLLVVPEEAPAHG